MEAKKKYGLEIVRSRFWLIVSNENHDLYEDSTLLEELDDICYEMKYCEAK